MSASPFEWWRGLRDRWLSSERFRRAALAFPLTRGIARRRAEAVFDLCAGFVYSQVLLACVRLRVVEQFSAGTLDIEAVAARISLPPDSTRRLLWAAASLRILEHRGGSRFGLGPLGAALVDNAAVAAMVEHHALFYTDLADPVALLRGEAAPTALARYWAYACNDSPQALSPRQTDAYTSLMASSQSLVAGEILDAYPVHRHRCLLDVGGGDGTFLLAAAARSPTLRLTLFDVPPVAARAQDRFREADLSTRATAVAGNFLSDPLPPGADLVSLVRIVHDHPDDAVRDLLRSAHAALPPGGVLLIAEPMADTPGAERVCDAYFGFYLLAMGRGRARTPREIAALLKEAGFRDVRQIPTRLPMQTSVVVATAH